MLGNPIMQENWPIWVDCEIVHVPFRIDEQCRKWWGQY